MKALLWYLLIGMVIEYITIRKINKKINTLGYVLFIITAIIWPVEIAVSIRNKYFINEEEERMLDDGREIINKLIFDEEDP